MPKIPYRVSADGINPGVLPDFVLARADFMSSAH